MNSLHIFAVCLKRLSFILILLCGAFVSPHSAYAIDSIDTKYFTIIYDENGEFTAGEIAKFCDDVYEKLMATYDSFDDNPRVTCLVNDAVDLANGYAIYYQNTITIYATNMDYELRGQSSWLRNVFVHEMTHMVALKKAARGPVNYTEIGGGKYNKNPDFDISVALYHLSQPAWFSEGTAQVAAETYGSERWDTHRDMVLRAAWYENSLLNFDEMSVLSGQKGMDAEMVYNQGYALLRYIKNTYGYDKVIALNNSSGLFDFNPTISGVLGISSKKLYENWSKSLDERYASFRNRPPVEGELAQDNGAMDYFPAVSPDGRYLAWLSDRGRDYAITDLMLTDLSTGKTRRIVKDVDYRVSWSHDSARLIYVKRPPKYPNFYDIYTFDIKTEKERRISVRMRGVDPSFSPGDSLIVFVRNEGGNNALAVMNADGSGLRYLTSTHDGTQFYRPSFSPDGSRIIFGLYRQNQDRDIAIIDAGERSYRYKWDIADSTSGYSDSTSFAEEANFKLMIGSSADERDPCFLPDGSGFVYSSDRTGVFNIYKLDFATSRASRLTDVYGGAFCPSAAGNGEVYYAGYKARDFSIYRTSLDKTVEEIRTVNEDRTYLVQPEKFDLSKNFAAQPLTRKRIVNAIVPTFNIGPSFIGSRFGLNVVNMGADVYVSDLLGQDAFMFSGSVGKNLKEDVRLNNSFDIYYQRKLVPVTSSTYTHSPTLYAEVSRAEIHNLIGRLNGEADSVYFADIDELGYKNVLHDLHQEITISDIYRHEFRDYTMGIHIPLAPRHSFIIEGGHREYYETLGRDQNVKDLSTFTVNGNDITDQVPGARSSWLYQNRFFTDLEYFSSNELSLAYSYSRIKPTADSDISPQGTAALFRYKHMRAAVADSLVGQITLYVPMGIYSDGSFAMGSYQMDPLLDDYRPYTKKLDVNEYLLYLQRNQKMPQWNHVLSGTALIGYRDLSLKDPWKGEGSGYEWPLKYYLGGRILSGYPYFAFWGSKIFYSRFEYVFPVQPYIFRNVLGLQFQRLYGSAFFEAAKTWNFQKMSMDRIRAGSFKRDVGVELRLKMVSFYRLTTLLTARIAWPLDDMNDSPYKDQRDARRYYFELRM
ncbi:hypothetical protein LLG96_03400 [bacterium]|nr:hypothetical protein [bacterium]